MKGFILATGKPRYVYLDFARGIGSLLVAAWHIRYAPRLDSFSIINVHYAVVDFFFILSGFVLFPRLQRFDQAKPGEPTHRWFLWHRFLRLWPMTILVLTSAFLLGIVTYYYQSGGNSEEVFPVFSTQSLWGIFVALCFGQIFVLRAYTWYTPLWSISALWWATVLTVVTPHFKKIRYEWILIFLGLSIEIYCIAFHGTSVAEGDNNYGLIGFARALVGFNIGLILRRNLSKTQRVSNKIFVTLSLFAFGTLLVTDFYVHNRAVLVTPWLFVPFILLLANLDTTRLSEKQVRICSTAGRYSFPIFIWHILMVKVYYYFEAYFNIGKYGVSESAKNNIMDAYIVRYIIIVSATIVISGLSMKFLEPPLERFVERIGLKYLPFLRNTPSSQVL